MDFYDALFNTYETSLFEFLIRNNKEFSYIPLDGTFLKDNDKCLFKTNYLSKDKNHYEYFEVTGEDPRRLIEHPENTYVNLILFGEDYELLVVYSKKPDREAVKELDRLTFTYYLKYYNIDCEAAFIKNVRRCMNRYNRENPGKETSLDELLSKNRKN